jgi:HEAT repeat protein
MAVQLEIDSLINALREEREGLRAFAAEKLLSIGSAAVPALIRALQLGEPAQEAAARTLLAMGSVAVPFLREAMQSENRQVAWSACWLLGSMSSDVRNTQLAPKRQFQIVPVADQTIAGWSNVRREQFGSYVADVRHNRSKTVQQRRTQRLSVQRSALRELQERLSRTRNWTSAPSPVFR